MSGWVYVVTNKSIRDLVKVGYTTRRDLNQRLREFNQAGLPYPYERAYALWVEEPRLIEKQVHQALAIHRENKEWFRCSVEHAKEAIEQIAGPRGAMEQAKAIVPEHKHGGSQLTPADWDRLRAKRPSDPQTHASQLPGRRPDQADEGDQEPARKRGHPQIQRDHLPRPASKDLAPKPGWKLLEEIEGKPYRKIRRQAARPPGQEPPPWGCIIPVGLIMISPLFSMC